MAQENRQLNLRGDRFRPLTWNELTPEQRTMATELLNGQRGTEDRKRTYSPTFCARFPISGLRSSALNGPPIDFRSLLRMLSVIRFCSGVIVS